MPLFFSIGIQQALEEIAAAMLPGEQLSAFLDDVYMLGPLYKLVFGPVEERRNPAASREDHMAPRGHQCVGHSDRIRTLHHAEDGRAHGERARSVASDPHSA